MKLEESKPDFWGNSSFKGDHPKMMYQNMKSSNRFCGYVSFYPRNMRLIVDYVELS